MRVGEKLIAKNNIDITWGDSFQVTLLKKGQIVRITSIEKKNDINIFHVANWVNLDIPESNLDELFYTERRIRELKLGRINGSKNKS